MKKLMICGDKDNPVVKGLWEARKKHAETRELLDIYIEICPWDGYPLFFQESHINVELASSDSCKDGWSLTTSIEILRAMLDEKTAFIESARDCQFSADDMDRGIVLGLEMAIEALQDTV